MHERLHVALVHAARRAGFEVHRRGTTGVEAGLSRLLTALEVDCVLDVGGNRGQFAALLRDVVEYTGRIVSFEPVGAAFAAMTSSRQRDENWHGRQEALGSQSGFAQINVFSADNFSSFLSPSDYGERSFSTLEQVSRTETVTVRRLDEIWDDVTVGARNIFLKIDTQGRDMDVLASAGDRLNGVVGLMTEVPVQQIYHGSGVFTDTITTMLAFGFEITDLFPVTHDNQLRVVEFDCLMRRVV